MAWTRVCSADDVPEGEGRRFEAGSRLLAVFKVADDYFVTDDACPHGASSLAEGYVDPDCSVECIAHMARFSLKTGEVLAPQASSPLRVYDTRVSDHSVLVCIDD